MKLTTLSKGTETVPQRRISRRIRHACYLLIEGKVRTVKAAAEQVGLSRPHLSRTLHEAHVQAWIARKIQKTIGTAQMRAATVLTQLMDDAKSEHVRKDASEFFLGLAGHVVRRDAAPAINIGVNVIPGYHIDLHDYSREPDGPVIEHATRDDEPIEHTTTAEPSTVVPWHTVRPVGRG